LSVWCHVMGNDGTEVCLCWKGFSKTFLSRGGARTEPYGWLRVCVCVCVCVCVFWMLWAWEAWNHYRCQW